MTDLTGKRVGARNRVSELRNRIQNIVPTTGGSVALALPALTDVDVDEAWIQNAPTPLSLPTYVPINDEVVHPSVLYFPRKWNGWHYWMGMTPYTAGDLQYENPSLLVSQDGTNWQVPPGVTNPIVAKNGATYNADVNLAADPDGETVHMVWKESGATDIFYLMSTNDGGVTWTTRTKILETVITTERNVSPSILWDATAGKWMMWTVEIVASPNRLLVRTADTITGPWSAGTECTITLPTGRYLWHIDVQRAGDHYYMLVNDSAGEGGGIGSYSLAKSRDGYSWSCSRSNIITRDGGWDRFKYKAAFLPQIGSQGLEFRVWYGSSAPYFYVGESVLRFDRTRRINDRTNALVQGTKRLGGSLLCDLFDRPDTTSGLGDSSSGHTWVASIATMGVAARKAYPVADVNTMALLNAGTSAYTAQVQVDAVGASAWLVFRWQDAANFWRFGVGGTFYVLERIMTGEGRKTVINGSLPATNLGPWSAGSRIAVRTTSAGVIDLFVNEQPVASLTDVKLASATWVGIQADKVAARFSNFLVRS